MKERDELIEEAKAYACLSTNPYTDELIYTTMADFALEVLERESIYREICEAAEDMIFDKGKAAFTKLSDGTYSATKYNLEGKHDFDTLPEAFEFVKGTGSRWEFIEKATKDIDSWTDSEKAEIHPQRAFNSTQENGMQSEQQAREAAVTAFEQAVQNGILDFDPLVACYYGFKSGYDSRDAEVEALREQLREARSLAAGWAEIAVSSGTQETK